MSPSAAMRWNEMTSVAFCGSPMNISPCKSIDDVGGGVEEPPVHADYLAFVLCYWILCLSLWPVPYLFEILHIENYWSSCDKLLKSASWAKSQWMCHLNRGVVSPPFVSQICERKIVVWFQSFLYFVLFWRTFSSAKTCCADSKGEKLCLCRLEDVNRG